MKDLIWKCHIGQIKKKSKQHGWLLEKELKNWQQKLQDQRPLHPCQTSSGILMYVLEPPTHLNKELKQSGGKSQGIFCTTTRIPCFMN